MENTFSDYELIKRFINGEEWCFEELVNRHKNKVYSYINMYVRDQALVEDIFQDTFMKVLQSFKSGKYRDDGKFLSWVTRIAHNLIIDYFRSVKQMNVVSTDSYEVDLLNSLKLTGSNVEEVLVDKQIRKDTRRIINQLPEEQREVVVLRYFADLSFKEIADFTGVSINTALGRMRYALINMRKIMEEKSISLIV